MSSKPQTTVGGFDGLVRWMCRQGLKIIEGKVALMGCGLLLDFHLINLLIGWGLDFEKFERCVFDNYLIFRSLFLLNKSVI